MSDEKSKEVVKADEGGALAEWGRDNENAYKVLRLRIAEVIEKRTNDKGQALDIVERWERSVWAAVHFSTPTARDARDAFMIAGERFLSEAKE